jgi:hypothetical protein
MKKIYIYAILICLTSIQGFCFILKTCGGHLSGLYGAFQSPRFPKNYPYNTTCTWTIQVPIRHHVRLTFTEFHIGKYRADCAYDHGKVLVKEGSTNDQLGIFCGSEIPKSAINTRGDSMVVQLKAGKSEGSGFIAHFASVVMMDNCAFNNGGCTHFCHNYIGGYYCSCRTGYELQDDGRNCTADGTRVVIKRGLKGVIHSSEVWSYWKIIAPDGYHIELRFTDFDVDRVYMDKVGNFPVCLFGQVLVYPDDSSECKQYCGTLGYRKRVLSKTNVMIVEFYDYSADSFGGYGFFRAMYQARPPSCGDPGTPSNGTKIGETYTFPNLVRYSCNAGFHLVGSSARKCQINGSWSGSPATCQRDRCGDPGVPLQGIIASFTSNKDEVTLQCQTLYVGGGGYHYRKCLENGTWSGRPFICRPSG